MTPEDVWTFWEQAGEARWFSKDAAFDDAVKTRFGQALAHATSGGFDHWGEMAEGALGLVILLDQMPRNIHRGSPLAFAADARALELAKSWIGKGYHKELPPPRAMWLCMPFEHSENIDDQRRCVELFESLGLNGMVHWAKLHLDIIAKFGRFPHRNSILGRTSTAEEIAFLEAGGFSG